VPARIASSFTDYDRTKSAQISPSAGTGLPDPVAVTVALGQAFGFFSP